MTSEDFELLLGMVTKRIEKQNTKFSNSCKISFGPDFAIFGVGEVCRAIVEVLREYIKINQRIYFLKIQVL